MDMNKPGSKRALPALVAPRRGRLSLPVIDVSDLRRAAIVGATLADDGPRQRVFSAGDESEVSPTAEAERPAEPVQPAEQAAASTVAKVNKPVQAAEAALDVRDCVVNSVLT